MLLTLSALWLVLTGIRVLVLGAHPPEGTGSLGHVGMIVAGGGMIFLSLIAALFAFTRLQKSGPGLTWRLAICLPLFLGVCIWPGLREVKARKKAG